MSRKRNSLRESSGTVKSCSLLRTRYCRLINKRRRDAFRTRIKGRMKKGRMIVLKVERKAKKGEEK